MDCDFNRGNMDGDIMGLQKETEHLTGAFGDYWKIHDLTILYMDNLIYATVGHYVSQEAASEGKTPLQTVNVKLAYTPSINGDYRKAVYPKLKELSEFAGAVDV